MKKCLIVTSIANEFEQEIGRLASEPIPVKACTTVEQALASYSNETILFGSPVMIVELLAQMPTIEWVQSSWAGVTPFIEHAQRDYILTGVKDVFGPQMSEYTLGYLLAHELKINQRLAEQRKHNWFQAHSEPLAGKQLGIMGTGSIGQHIAMSAKYMGLKVIGLSRSGRSTEEIANVLPVEELHDFLRQCDHVVSTLPDTPITQNLLDAEALAHLPAHACFVNVGRGSVVDDDALMAALNRGSLAGAVLDVFDEEPLPDDSPLWDTPNLSITAHISAISHPLLLVPIFVENYQRFLRGETLKHIVDFEHGY